MKELERNRIGKSEGTNFTMLISSENVISNDREKSPAKISKEDFSSNDSK